nr:ATP synthase F0 subunit 8 [Tomicodon reitzae]
MPQLLYKLWLNFFTLTWLVLPSLVAPLVLAHTVSNEPSILEQPDLKPSYWTWPWR